MSKYVEMDRQGGNAARQNDNAAPPVGDGAALRPPDRR